MSDALLLGIDAGTSVIKAALFDRDGHMRAVTARATDVHTPRPAWSEASPAQFWEKTVEVIRELLAGAGVRGEQVAALGITGNMVGAWLIDGAGDPVRDAILWNDGRSQSLIDRLSAEQPGFMSRIFASSGSVMQQGCTLPVIGWLAEHEPDVLGRAAHVLCCKDWLRFKLTGARFTDQTEASVMPGDTRARTYNEALFDLLGIRRYRRLFPEILPSERISGHIIAQAAALTTLAAGTPVVAGAGDVPATIIGAGAGDPGTACVILGTTCLSCLSMAQPGFTPPDVGLLFCLPGGGWARVMANIAGTTNLDWFIGQFFAHERGAAASTAELFARLEADVRSSEPGANGVLYHPYLSPVGVIAPFVEPGARAVFSGLLPTHTRGDLLRAVYEGVALAIRDCYAAMGQPPAEVWLTGGGGNSELWGQIIADCLGVRVVVPEGSEFGAKGAALLAGVGIGWYSDVGAAARAIRRVLRAHEPAPERIALYDALYERYRAVREAMLPVWKRGS